MTAVYVLSSGLSGCVSREGGRGEVRYLKASQIQLGSAKSTQVVPIELNVWKPSFGSSQISDGVFRIGIWLY